VPQVPRLQTAQWQLLRHLVAREKTVEELATAVARRNSSVGRSLTALSELGLLHFRAASEEKRTGRGNPSGWWGLTDEGRELAEDAIPPVGEVPAGPSRSGVADAPRGPEAEPERDGPWSFERHQAFARATVTGPELPTLLDVLAHGEQGAEASFVARLDGDRHEYLFVFDSRLGARPAEVLGAALDAASLRCTIGVVADVRGFGAMVSDARAAGGGAGDVRARRAATPDASSPE
jgi:DNA-binding MarR family transcriptional regulator